MPKQIKRIIVWAFWIFVIYAILTDPNRAAELLRMAWSILVNGFNSVMLFFDRLIGR